MANIEEIVQTTAAFCDCVPGLSTVTNATTIVYQLAHKVDQTAKPSMQPIKPNKTQWKDEIKIHAITKSKFDCFIGMIPILGNIRNIYHYIRHGLQSPLQPALVAGNTEAVQLYLATHNLADLDSYKPQQILQTALNCPKPELLQSILNARTWQKQEIVNALQQYYQVQNSHPQNAEALLDYYQQHYTKRDFSDFKEILNKNFPLTGSPSSLTREQMQKIFTSCTSYELLDLVTYCCKIHEKTQKKGKDNDLYHFHCDLIRDFLSRTPNSLKTVHPITHSVTLQPAFSKLLNANEEELLPPLLSKYGQFLSVEDKQEIIIGNISTKPESSAILGFFLDRCGFSVSEYLDLLENLAKRSSGAPLVQQFAKYRPEIEETHPQELKRIIELASKNKS